MNWPKPPPPPPASWGASSIVSEATAENLSSGAEELKVQQEKMMEATTRLLSVVSEVGGGPWEASPGLTERALTEWMGEQEDRVDELKERIERKQGELARLEEVEEEGPIPDKALPNFDAAFRFNSDRDISSIEERRLSGGSTREWGKDSRGCRTPDEPRNRSMAE